jgi:hypothetical protein
VVAGARGRIVVVTAAGQLGLSDPDGRNLMLARGLGTVGALIAASPGSRYLSLLNGQLVAMTPGRRLAAYPARVPLTGNTTIAWPDPFADHERALAMLLDYGALGQSASNPIMVVSLATGRQVSLGTGDQVAGDPQAPGVVASVPAQIPPSAAPAQFSRDSGVVIRDAGQPPVLLATAVDLNRWLGEPGHVPVSLAPYPAPSGALVAVAVQPAAGGPTSGIVVLSRTGRPLGTVRVSLAPRNIPVWSPSGRSLAYLSAGAGGLGLGIWTIGGHVMTRPLPHATGTYSACVWSPNGGSVLCGGTDGGAWAIAPARSGQPVAVRGSGSPVAWLP